ncbi:hypothetical protein PUN4_640084 [Paraburkholderia unamae]|nr:hypothetical protein PUN4_640084 [Paraburkholderia unamae]
MRRTIEAVHGRPSARDTPVVTHSQLETGIQTFADIDPFQS